MGQWFRYLWNKLFPKKIILREPALLTFNEAKLQEAITSTHERLYACREEQGFTLLMQNLERFRNLKLLQVGHLKAGDSLELAKRQGAVEALAEFYGFLMDAIDPNLMREIKKAKAEKKNVRVLKRAAEPVL